TTITDLDALAGELAATRTRGYGVCAGELEQTGQAFHPARRAHARRQRSARRGWPGGTCLLHRRNARWRGELKPAVEAVADVDGQVAAARTGRRSTHQAGAPRP